MDYTKIMKDDESLEKLLYLLISDDERLIKKRYMMVMILWLK